MGNKYLEMAGKAFPEVPDKPFAYARYAAECAESGNMDKARELLDFFEENVFSSGDEAAADFWKSLFIAPLYDGEYLGKAIYANADARGAVYEMLGRGTRRMWEMYGEYLKAAEDISEKLKNELPDGLDDDDSDLPYIAAGRAAEHIVKLFAAGDMDGTKKWLCFVEKLCADENKYISELGVIGYVEDMQNYLDRLVSDSAEGDKFRGLLGEHSLRAWDKLREYWGEIQEGKDKNDP